MTHPNYKFIHQNYMLPSWFIYNDIDWHRYYPLKDGKYIYKCNKKVKGGSNDDIYDDEKVIIHSLFVKYLTYINDIKLENDITDEEMDKLLNIKVCDYDWLFMWHNPVYDKNSEELLLQKIYT